MLSQFVTAQLFAFLLVFCRLGSALMLLPGFGEAYVTPRARLMLALIFSVLLVPVMQAVPIPNTTFGVLNIMLAEILVGIFLGALARMMIAGVHMAGSIIAYQSSLASALTNDITTFQGQDTSLGNLLGMTAIVMLFATDMHHYMLKGLADSYTLFLPGQFPLVGDFANHATRMMSATFQTAMQMAAPSIVVGTMTYLGAGIIARLMPNIQIFFIMLPVQLLVSSCVLLITISAIMLWYMDFFRETLFSFLAP